MLQVRLMVCIHKSHFIWYSKNWDKNIYDYIHLEFATRPEYWKELREEQEAIAGDLDSDLTMDRINKMEKLDSFVKESLRLRGSVREYHILAETCNDFPC